MNSYQNKYRIILEWIVIISLGKFCSVKTDRKKLQEPKLEFIQSGPELAKKVKLTNFLCYSSR